MNFYLITGVSQGLGKTMFNTLSSKYNCVGLTSKKKFESIDNNIYFFDFEDFNYENNKIINYLKKFVEYKFIIIFNAVIYDQTNDTHEDKKRILNINFYNQIKFAKNIKDSVKPNHTTYVFLSSFEVFNINSKLPFYKKSKELYIKEYKNNHDKNLGLSIKLFILGGIRTQSYLKNKKLTFFKRIITAKTVTASNFIIKNINIKNDRIIFYPKIYRFLNFLKNKII